MAFEVLRAVSESDAYANLVLPGRLRSSGLTGRDAALTTELVYGTLRRSGSYEAIVTSCIDRPWSKVDRPIQDILRIGCHQLLGMDVPTHAAVATTVELAKTQVGRGRAGFVNAVLRKVAGRTYDEWVDLLVTANSLPPTEQLALRHAHPVWLVDAFSEALLARGRELDELGALLSADNLRPQVTLVARPGRCTREELVDAGGELGRWSPFAVIWPAGDPGVLPAVRQHRAGVQDEGSQLVTSALADADLATGREHERWLDMCAGPGGKAALLTALADERGATLEAWEILPHRAALVRQAVGRAVTVRVVDASDPERVTELKGAEGQFDRVLLDAPCSGTGALRRRPEARWRKQPGDIPDLVAGQRDLLTNALRLVRPGGVVGYVTCSPLVAETSHVVESVLGDHRDVELVDARSSFPSALPDLGDGPDVLLWPHRHGTDAMYLALLRRGEG